MPLWPSPCQDRHRLSQLRHRHRPSRLRLCRHNAGHPRRHRRLPLSQLCRHPGYRRSRRRRCERRPGSHRHCQLRRSRHRLSQLHHRHRPCPSCTHVRRRRRSCPRLWSARSDGVTEPIQFSAVSAQASAAADLARGRSQRARRSRTTRPVGRRAADPRIQGSLAYVRMRHVPTGAGAASCPHASPRGQPLHPLVFGRVSCGAASPQAACSTAHGVACRSARKRYAVLCVLRADGPASGMLPSRGRATRVAGPDDCYEQPVQMTAMSSRSR